MTTFLNLMVVLVPFLLITAVFSRITIVELDLPSNASGPVAVEPGFRLEVIVRDDGLELANGRSIFAAIPKDAGEYDLATLSDHVIALKGEHPDAEGASILLEPQIAYDHLIRVMDVVRSTERLPASDEAETDRPEQVDPPEPPDPSDRSLTVASRVLLFPNIAIGDAP